jgi:hypothetical protein
MPSFYHLANTDRGTPVGRMCCNNLVVSHGCLTSDSFWRWISPERSKGFKSPYEIFTQEADKEAVWEQVRAQGHPHRPPRLGSVFLFESIETAQQYNLTWFSGRRTLLESEVLEGNLARLDAKYLDCQREFWSYNASMYWLGMRTGEPVIEVVVQGVIRLLGYEQYAALWNDDHPHPSSVGPAPDNAPSEEHSP